MSARFRPRRRSPLAAVGVAAAMLTVSHPSIASSQPAATVPPPEARPSIRSRPLPEPPTIDGVLDDGAWREGPVEIGELLTYNPLYGDKVPQQTRVWIGHDAGFLYFAFQCDDPHPSDI